MHGHHDSCEYAVCLSSYYCKYNRLSDNGFRVSRYPTDYVRNTAFLLAMPIDCANIVDHNIIVLSGYIHYWPSVIGKGRQ